MRFHFIALLLSLCLASGPAFGEPTKESCVARWQRIKADVREHPNNEERLGVFGSCATSTERLPEATQFLKNLAVEKGHGANTFKLLGIFQLAQKDFDGALASIQKAIQENANDASLYDWLYNTYLAKKDLPHAIRAAEKAAQLDPKDANTLTKLGYAYAVQEDYRACVAYSNKAIALDAANAEAYTNLGACEDHLSHLSEARRALEQAVALAPALPAAHENLGHVLMEMGDAVGAEHQMKILKSIDPAAARSLKEFLDSRGAVENGRANN